MRLPILCIGVEGDAGGVGLGSYALQLPGWEESCGAPKAHCSACLAFVTETTREKRFEADSVLAFGLGNGRGGGRCGRWWYIQLGV